jgi:hypothetical protein
MINSEFIPPLFCGLLCAGSALVILIGAIALVVINQKNSQKKFDIPAHWHSVQGQVKTSFIEEVAHTHVDEDTFYHPVVEFEYTVNGQHYAGKQAIGRATNFDRNARKTLENYPIGGNITVYYNPEKVDEYRLKII